MICLKDSLYFRGYEIEAMKEPFILTDEEYDLLDACYWMVRYEYTIRQAATNSGFAKSTLHRKIHHELRYISPDLYKAVKKQIKKNLKNRGKRR